MWNAIFGTAGDQPPNAASAGEAATPVAAEEESQASVYLESTHDVNSVGDAAATTPENGLGAVGKDGDGKEFDSDTETPERHLSRQSWLGQNSMMMLLAETEAVEYLLPEKTMTLRKLTPVLLSLVAVALCIGASWDCVYFKGALISFTGNSYGLWTVQDSTGKCQLWDVLFFSYALGRPLLSARCLSMISMLVGLGLLAALTQASQFHLISWGIGIAFIVLLLISVLTTNIYNVWVIFWFFSYLLYTLIVRWLFVHPVPRRISPRGIKIIAILFWICAACCVLTLVVLSSKFCTCQNLTEETLAGRDPGQPCNGTCALGLDGYMMMVSAVFYIACGWATFTIGIQPDELKENKQRPATDYAFYPKESLVTRVALAYRRAVSSDARSKASSDRTQPAPTNEKPALTVPQTEDPETTAPSSLTMGTATASTNMNVENVLANNSNPGSTRKVAFSEEAAVVYQDENKADQQEPEGNANSAIEVDATDYANVEEEDEDLEDILDKGKDTRNFCSKCCCDFRITPRSRKERWCFWINRTFLGIGFGLYVFVICILSGSRKENTDAALLPDTTPYFIMPQVCAFNPKDPNQPFQTFANETLAHAANWTIAHCGECGTCSNPHDIIVYVETRKTIAIESKKCGPDVYLKSYEDLADCLQDRIGFTRNCTYCWADNMISTGTKCLFTCMKTLFSGLMGDNNVKGAGDQGWMNQCLFCDERNSGPKFVTCSGVARRRLGIVSEIERNPEEQCKRVDINWVTVNFTEIGFEKLLELD